MGDGATNQGPFYESLNPSSLWNLPVVFVIENNGYSMGTSESRHSAGEPLAKRGDPFDVNWSVHQGHDLYEVRKRLETLLHWLMKSKVHPCLRSLPTDTEAILLLIQIKPIEARKRLRNIKRTRIPLTCSKTSCWQRGSYRDTGSGN